MSIVFTSAGDSLRARLQAEGKPLIIDTMILASVPGVDPAVPLSPGIAVPEEHVVLTYAIPPEYRAYVNPDQVVYSAMLGSDVGDFSFNWQGLYSSEHKTLIAAATFPALEKRRYDEATGKSGNNITRNFLLTFTGARELTGLTISADVWQLDFTVRLNGMDERERLSNFDIYGQGYFERDAWLLALSGGSYSFAPGLGYVGGIRIMLPEALPLAVTIDAGGAIAARDVYLSTCLRPQGSDRVAEVSPLLVDMGTEVKDIHDETGLAHYRQIVARINTDGSVTDLRPKRLAGVTPENIGAVPVARKITGASPLNGGGDLSVDRTIGIDASSHTVPDFVIRRDAAGRAKVAAPAAADDIARKAEVNAISTTVDAHARLTIAHGATSAPTAERIILRDKDGRAKVAAPLAADDIARKAEVDAAKAKADEAYKGRVRRGMLQPCHKVFFGGSDGRRPIFWGESEPDENYVIADGGSDGEGGKVPDARDRMIMGAGPKHPAGTTGGEETHEHGLSGTVGAVTLTEAQLASHPHSITLRSASGGNSPSAPAAWNGPQTSGWTNAAGGSQPHTHGLTDGSVATGSSLSPFYALAMVVRIK